MWRLPPCQYLDPGVWAASKGIKRFRPYLYSSANAPILWPGSRLPGIMEKLLFGGLNDDRDPIDQARIGQKKAAGGKAGGAERGTGGQERECTFNAAHTVANRMRGIGACRWVGAGSSLKYHPPAATLIRHVACQCALQPRRGLVSVRRRSPRHIPQQHEGFAHSPLHHSHPQGAGRWRRAHAQHHRPPRECWAWEYMPNQGWV